MDIYTKFIFSDSEYVNWFLSHAFGGTLINQNMCASDDPKPSQCRVQHLRLYYLHIYNIY